MATMIDILELIAPTDTDTSGPCLFAGKHTMGGRRCTQCKSVVCALHNQASFDDPLCPRCALRALASFYKDGLVSAEMAIYKQQELSAMLAAQEVRDGD